MADQPATPAVPATGRIVPRPLTQGQKVAAFLIHALLRCLTVTYRYRLDDQSGLFTGELGGPVIFCGWHNRLAVVPWVVERILRKKRPGPVVALISASGDGGLLARTFAYFGIQAVRGSSSRRGPQALIELKRYIDRGFHVGITPDGPRGPRYKVQPGLIALAQLTGAPVMPVGTYTRNKVCTRSWDRFQIPLPFSLCHVRIGEPLHVPRVLSEADRLAYRQQLEDRLNALCRD